MNKCNHLDCELRQLQIVYRMNNFFCEFDFRKKDLNSFHVFKIFHVLFGNKGSWSQTFLIRITYVNFAWIHFWELVNLEIFANTYFCNKAKTSPNLGTLCNTWYYGCVQVLCNTWYDGCAQVLIFIFINLIK